MTNRSQSTLADGTYSFTLPVGNYLVSASAAGHAADYANVAVTEGNVSSWISSFVPVLTPTPTPTPTVTTPTVTPTPNGFVPPDTDVLGCEKAVDKALAKLGACLRNCCCEGRDGRVQGPSVRPIACATGTPKKSCRAKFDATSQRVLDKGICPPCLDGARQAAFADRVTVEVESETADLYCEGTVPLP